MNNTKKFLKAQINEDLLLALIMLLCIICMAVFFTAKERKYFSKIEKNKINIIIENKMPKKHAKSYTNIF